MPTPEATAAPRQDPPLSALLLTVADLLSAVRQGRSLSDQLEQLPPRLRPGAQALSFHVLRWRASAEAARAHLAPRMPPPAVDALLVCALALLWRPSGPPYPPHTLVDQAVAATRRRHGASANFVNAVLRRFLRETDAVEAAVASKEEARWHHPAWWIRHLRADWGPRAEPLLMAAQAHPPMTLRANATRTEGAALIATLAEAGVEARALRELRAQESQQGPSAATRWPLPHAVVLDTPSAVTALPGFAQGLWSVQDAAAQLAAPLLLGAEGLGVAELPAPAGRPLRVLDACAAPGGKTAHLMELAAARGLRLDLLALDSEATRLVRVEQTLARLGLDHLEGQRVRCLPADAGAPDTWWDGERFDAILLDAPCTASGIERRHPDIRWLRRPQDVPALARQQARLLVALWPLLQPGGRLLYATCSVFKAEGQQQIDAFLQRPEAHDARLDPAAPGHLLPLPHNEAASPHDGFYYALLHKD